MNFAQRTLAALSATGTAALMALPVLAQAVPNQGVVNNGDINRIENQIQPTNTQTPDNCAFVSGGIGGPIDNSTSSMVTPNRQFDANNRSAAIAYRSNGPAGTSGHEAKMNLDAFQERQRENSYPTAYNLGTPQASAPLPVACVPR